jgi:hypothetical protein
MSEQEDLDIVRDPAEPPRRGRPVKANVLAGDVVAPPQPAGQKIVSSRTRIGVTPPEGDSVRMRVTAKGDGQISAGSDYGFDRYAMFAEFVAPERSARSLYNKGWAEPLDDPQNTVRRWEQENAADRVADAKSGKRLAHLLEHGAPAGVTDGWNG